MSQPTTTRPFGATGLPVLNGLLFLALFLPWNDDPRYPATLGGQYFPVNTGNMAAWNFSGVLLCILTLICLFISISMTGHKGPNVSKSVIMAGFFLITIIATMDYDSPAGGKVSSGPHLIFYVLVAIGVIWIVRALRMPSVWLFIRTGSGGVPGNDDES